MTVPSASPADIRLLAIDTSQADGSVAALSGSNLLAEITLPPDQGSARSLAPAIKALLDRAGWQPKDVQVVAVTVGPGSFTGLRVGLTTARAFAYSVQADMVGVDTLETIAAGSPAGVDMVAIAMDAQRGEVVAATYRRDADGRFSATGPSRLVDLGAWLAALPPGISVAGPILKKVAPELLAHAGALEPRYWSPSAAAVGRLAAYRYSQGHRDDLWHLALQYSRRSAAEEKWEQNNRQPETPAP